MEEKKPEVLIVGGGCNYAHGIQQALELVLKMETIPYILHGQESPTLNKIMREKPKTECLLKGCDNLTSHNKGYCCADHFRESRTI